MTQRKIVRQIEQIKALRQQMKKVGSEVAECERALANDAQEPVKSEFRTIIETQTIGMPVGEACAASCGC